MPGEIGGADELHGLEERLEPQPARAAGETSGGKDVRRAGGVVADDGGRSNEDGACVADPGDERLRVCHPELQMLRRVGLGERDRLVERGHVLDGDVVRAGDEIAYGEREIGIEAEQDRFAVRAVLGLREQVGGAARRDRPRHRRSGRPRSAPPAGRSRLGSRRAAWPRSPSGFRGRRSCRPARSSRCRTRARLPPGRRRPHRPRRFRAHAPRRASPRRASASRPRSVRHPATCAGTAAMTSEDG